MHNSNYPLQEQTNLLIGIAFDIHTILGKGFLEIVYKDAFLCAAKGVSVGIEFQRKLGTGYWVVKALSWKNQKAMAWLFYMQADMY